MIQFIEHGVNSNNQTIYARVDEDGLVRFTCTAENPEYVAFLEEQEKEDN
jgi:hypothetical protein